MLSPEDDVVPIAVAGEILAAAANVLPLEACGVLLGVMDGALPRVTAQRVVQNSAQDATRRFAIPAEHVRQAQLDAQRDGVDVIGFWHSHPQGPGAPSVEDLTTALPGYLYVIVDVRTGALTAWRLRDDRRAFEPVDG